MRVHVEKPASQGQTAEEAELQQIKHKLRNLRPTTRIGVNGVSLRWPLP